MSVLPEKQKMAPQTKEIVENKPRLGQGRVGIRHKKTPTSCWHNYINKYIM